MLNKSQIHENLKKNLGNEIMLHNLNEEKILNFTLNQVMLSCKPDCNSCFDKGYSTSFYGIRTAPDFEGEREAEEPMRSHMLYCHCAKGQELKKIIEENYNPK